MKGIVVATPVGLVLCATAHAQTLPNPYTVRIGYSSLTDGTARDTTKASGYTFGFGYDFGDLNGHGLLSLDLDFDVHRGNGNKIESAALMLVGRLPFSQHQSKEGLQPYYGLGVGISRSFVDFTSSTVSGSSTTITNMRSIEYKACAELLIGAKVAKKTTVELFYRVGAQAEGIKAGTVGLTVGVHF